MTVAELTSHMYYSQPIRIYEVNPYDATIKTLRAQITNAELRSIKYKKLRAYQVIGFGVVEKNIIDINVKSEVQYE